jgi:hypothetical protein
VTDAHNVLDVWVMEKRGISGRHEMCHVAVPLAPLTSKCQARLDQHLPIEHKGVIYQLHMVTQ